MTGFLDRSAPELQASASFLTKSGNGRKSANDSLGQKAARAKGYRTTGVYITRADVDGVKARMGDIHWAMLRDVGRLGVMTGKQLARLHHEQSDAGERLARKKLAQLSSWRVLTRLGRPMTGWGFAYAVGPAGQRLLRPDRKRYRTPWTPRPSYLRHALTISDLYVALREVERTTGGMELVIFDAEPACWRSYFGPGGARVTLKPDALTVVHLEDFEDRYFIEADCSTEPGPRISEKARAYVRYWQSGQEDEAHGIFPYVLWLTPTEKRKGFISETLAKLPPEVWQLFMVATASEAPELIATGITTSINRKEVNP
jgi:Replication-relaxation